MLPPLRSSFALLMTVLCVAQQVSAEPYRPTDPGELIEKVPEALRGAEGKEFAELKSKVEAEPGNRQAAIDFTKLCISRGRRLNDPRFFGYAEAVNDAHVAKHPGDPELLTLRAILRQRRHDFLGAKEDLEKVLKKNGSSAQGWVTLATVQLVLGDVAGSRSSCARIVGLTSELSAAACVGLAASLSGNAEKAYAEIESALKNATDSKSANEGEILWAISILGEIAERLGRNEDAEKWYRESLAKDPEDSFGISAYADFLLDHGRPQEALTLLRGREAADNLLLRLVIAEKRTSAPELELHRKMLKERFEAEERRGESIHARERAMFALEVEQNSKEAAELAKQNWSIQKEALDLLVLVRASVAAKDAAGMKEARDWVQRTGWEDVRVKKILDESVR